MDSLSRNVGNRACERRLFLFKQLQARAQAAQHLGVEPGSDTSRVDEFSLLVIPQKQGSEADPRAFGLGVSADHEFFGLAAFGLQPIGTAAIDIKTAAPLR